MFRIDKVVCDRKIILWGTGVNACRFLYEFSDIDIEYCIQPNHAVSSFLFLEVFEADYHHVKDKYVVIASDSWENYLETKHILESLGLNEFIDFVYSGFIEREIVLLHGNCHMQCVEEYLNSSAYFISKYSIYHTEPIQSNPEGRIDNIVLNNCDVMILQDIRTNTRFGYRMSYEYILNQLKTDAVVVVFPNPYGTGKVNTQT